MAKLDSNAAWKEASGLVAANRELFLALAGVFFLLPSLALAVLLGEPELPQGVPGERMLAALSAFYADNWWLLALSSVVQVVGVLAILTLMRDQRRPTVGEAIRAGAEGLLPYLAAQLLFVVTVSLLGGLAIAVAAVAMPALGVLATLAVIGLAAFAGIRLILVAPVVAVEGRRNPIAALHRSWALTRGNFWRIFAFLLLVAILFIVIVAVIMLIVGVILALVSEGDTQRVLAAAVSSALTAIAALYFVGILAAIHRQLATPAASVAAGPV